MSGRSASGDTEILVGGQAVLEGVMMKLPRAWAVTVRRSNGELECRSGVHVPWSERWPVLKLPVLRGIAVLFSTLGLGMRCLFFSSDVLAKDLEEKEQSEKGGGGPAGPGPMTLASLLVLQALTDGPDGTEVDDEPGEPTEPAEHATTSDTPDGGGMSTWEVVVSVGLAIGMMLLLFKALPLLTAQLAAKVWPSLGSPLGESVTSGIALLGIFVGYLLLLSLIPDIKRVFRYHGAEHKVVYLHEAGEEPTVDNARRHSTLHPRCGTSFLFFVIATSIVVWALFPLDAGFFAKLGLRLALFPFIIGLSYELIRLTSRHRARLLFRALVAPGLWSQRITTKPPDDSMLEVSLRSLALASQAHEGQAAGH